jgi:hypothetical protein
MSLAALAPVTIETVADLLESLGDIPPERIRMRPLPGTATEDDVLAVHASEKRLCELVDGVLVLDESRRLDGGNVLPGLEIPLRELFDRASRRRGPRE